MKSAAKERAKRRATVQAALRLPRPKTWGIVQYGVRDLAEPEDKFSVAQNMGDAVTAAKFWAVRKRSPQVILLVETTTRLVPIKIVP